MLKSNIIFFVSIIIISIIFFISIKADSNQEYDFCLRKSYEIYKNVFMTKDGRIIDYDKNNITTSEAQSYIMMRSLIIDDKNTFDLSYKWTKNNLQREDKLFAWLWGKNAKGEYKIIDNNSASDADVDIALALVLAYEKWGKYEYLMEAIPIIQSIWNKETKRIGNYLVLMPGVIQTVSEEIEINPSYFSPYAFRFFQKYDDEHDWDCIIDSSYYYLDAVMAKTQTHLPPNWFFIENGQIVLEDSEKSDFSYDALRVFLRINLDYLRTGDKRALNILSKSKFFIDKWGINDGEDIKLSPNIYTNYTANGEIRDKDKFVGSIAILIPAITLYNPDFAKELYKEEIIPYLKNEKYWELKKDYYAKNLLWFGCYLYNKDSYEYKEMHKLRIKNIK